MKSAPQSELVPTCRSICAFVFLVPTVCASVCPCHFISSPQLYSTYRGVLGPWSSAGSGFICRGPLKHIVAVPRRSHLPPLCFRLYFPAERLPAGWGRGVERRVSMNSTWPRGLSCGRGLEVAKRSWRSALERKETSAALAVSAERFRV